MLKHNLTGLQVKGSGKWAGRREMFLSLPPLPFLSFFHPIIYPKGCYFYSGCAHAKATSHTAVFYVTVPAKTVPYTYMDMGWRFVQPKFRPVVPAKVVHLLRWTGFFVKLFRLDRTDPLTFGPKFREILVEWTAPTAYQERTNELI